MPERAARPARRRIERDAVLEVAAIADADGRVCLRSGAERPEKLSGNIQSALSNHNTQSVRVRLVAIFDAIPLTNRGSGEQRRQRRFVDRPERQSMM
jgi:hypothetical protein